MPKFKFEEMEKMLSSGRLHPVYLVYGVENYLIRIIVDKICAVYKAEMDAEVERYSGKGLNAVSVIDSLKTLPMWSKGKLAIIDDASSLSDKSKELLENYVKSPSSTAVLIFVASKFDGRTKFYKLIDSNGAVIELAAIYDNQMPFWINRECKSKGYNISQEAANLMIGLIGTNLSDMASAVEKVVLYIGGAKKLMELKDVETVLSDTSQRTIFDLTNAVGAKKISLASDRLRNLLKNNESPVGVVAMLARHWRLLLRAKELIGAGVSSENDLARELGVRPFFVREYISQSKGYTRAALEKGLKLLWQSDKAIKSSSLANEEILHRLLLGLVGARV